MERDGEWDASLRAQEGEAQGGLGQADFCDVLVAEAAHGKGPEDEGDDVERGGGQHQAAVELHIAFAKGNARSVVVADVEVLAALEEAVELAVPHHARDGAIHLQPAGVLALELLEGDAPFAQQVRVEADEVQRLQVVLQDLQRGRLHLRRLLEKLRPRHKVKRRRAARLRDQMQRCVRGNALASAEESPRPKDQ